MSGHHAGHGAAAPRAVIRALWITLAFMAFEFLGGIYANSLALVSDAFHMLTDVGAMLLTLFALWLSKRPSTPQMSYGYHRAEILGALASGLLIWLISGILIYEAVERLQAPPEIHGKAVFIIASIGLAANLLSMWVLHDAKNHNLSVRGAYLHLFTDSLGSLGAVIAGALMTWTNWFWVDAAVTILFAALMLMSSWSLIREAVGVLMEAVPPGVDLSQIERELKAMESVQGVHDLHVWTVASGRLAFSAHLIAEQSDSLLSKTRELLEENHGIHHTTIQIERPGGSAQCVKSCDENLCS